MTDIFSLIKERRTIRKYQDKPIPKEALDKIIEAGIWGPSVVGSQPWKFIVIINKDIIKQIRQLLCLRIRDLSVGGRFVLHSTINALSTSQALIAVYNTMIFSKTADRLGKEYLQIARFAEIEAIAASIQNMLLVAEHLGVASCWFDTPLFCEKGINTLLKTKEKLVSILCFGYADEKGVRSRRKPFSEIVQYIV